MQTGDQRCFSYYRLQIDARLLKSPKPFVSVYGLGTVQPPLELDMEDEKELNPEQLAELRRLTKLQLEKAASLGITVVPHTKYRADGSTFGA